VYLGTLDGRLIALDAKSGHPVWEVLTADQSHPLCDYRSSAHSKGMVLIGNAGGEFGVRGYLSAYDAESGKLICALTRARGPGTRVRVESKWRVPRRLARKVVGCGRRRARRGTSIVYDPGLDLIYAGTGNGIVWYRDLRSPGGGRQSVISPPYCAAPSTGELIWYYQVTPGDETGLRR